MKNRSILLVALTIGLVGRVVAQDATIEYVAGDVWVESDGERFEADFGTALTKGDLVGTGADGVAVVTVALGSQIKLRENTVVALDQVRSDGTVELRQGGVFARVNRAVTGGNQRFTIRTPTVVAGVRGTEFFVAYGRSVEDRPDLWLCVNEGTVEVSVPDENTDTLVHQGEGVNILNGLRTSEPRPFEWTNDLNWNFDPSQGDVRDDTDLNAAYSDLLDQDYD